MRPLRLLWQNSDRFMKKCAVKDNLSRAPGSSGRADGFSLVELLIAMAVGLVVLGAMYSVFTIQNKTFSNQEQIVEMQQNARAAMDMMSREIRMAGYDPAGVNSDSNPSNNFSGVTVNASQIQIQADLDGSGVIDTTSQENIVYAFDAANKKITRNIGAGAQSFVENVDPVTFTYLDGKVNVPPTPSAVRITITGRTADGYRTYKLESVITLRN
jgi:type IV pilus assembly protein PilW